MARFLPVPGARTGPALLRPPPLPRLPLGLATACAVTAILLSPIASRTQLDQVAQSRRATLHVASTVQYVDCVLPVRACARQRCGTQPLGPRETFVTLAPVSRGGAAGRIT